jgi:DNA-binding transcriptional MerR regulator
MDAFTIKDLENLCGIKAHTIRIWEQRYSFLKPQRTGTNIRYYTNEELKKLLNVALLNKYGFKISHINRMTDDQIYERVISLTQSEAVQERIVNELITMIIDIDMASFEHILDNYIKLKGIERAITQVIFPLLEKIGILWHTNHIIPAQEHLVSNIIRQKFIFGIENASPHIKAHKTALLFLPENEHHELGLLYAYYHFKNRGFTVLYLGADTPLEDIKYITKRKKADIIYTHLISSPSNFNFDKFLANFTANIEETPLVISGKYAKTHRKNLPHNIHLKQSLAEVIEYVGSL